MYGDGDDVGQVGILPVRANRHTEQRVLQAEEGILLGGGHVCVWM